MRKYKAPGTYAHFIPTQQTVNTVAPLRAMAIVGTGQQFFERENVMITRDKNSIFDKLPNKNIVEVYSVSSNPVNARTQSINKIYTNYRLENDCIIWNQLAGSEYEPTYTMKVGMGEEAFKSNINVTITEPKFVTTNSYKIEISFVGKEDEGTFIVTDNSTSQIIGEYVARELPYTDIIPGISLKVSSTFVLVGAPLDSRTSKSKIGDYVTLNVTSAKCHVDPTVAKVKNNYSVDPEILVENGGSYYNIIGDGKDLVSASYADWPTLTNKFVINKNYTGVKFEISLYKNGVLTNADEMFAKLQISADGTIEGVRNTVKSNLLFDSLASSGTTALRQNSYNITSFVTASSTLINGDNFSLSYNYILKDDAATDQSDFIIKLEIVDTTDSVSNRTVVSMDNAIFVRNDIIPHTVSSYDNILLDLIKNVEIINPGNVKSALYKIKISDIANNRITIYNETDGELVGTYSTDVNAEFREAIPGVSFTLYSFNEIEGLLQMYDTRDIADLTGSTVYISTLCGITNPEVPVGNTTYYVSYKYAKSEEDYGPKVFYDYDEVLEAYGNYRVTSTGGVINSLSLGAELAFLNGAAPIVCVQAKNETAAEMEVAIDKLTFKIESLNNVNSIVPLTTSKVVGNYLLNHVNLYSSPDYNLPRMGYLAAQLNEEIYRLPTISNQNLGSIQAAQRYNDERIVYVTPGAVSKDIIDPITGYSSTKTLPGCYLAVAVAAIAMRNDVAEPLTNKEIVGFKHILSNYNESDMNDLATAGCLVVKQEGDTIKIRHGITTHGCIDTLADIQANEITMIQVKDFVTEGVKNKCAETYIGGKMKATILHDVQYTLEQLFNKYVADEIILGVKGLTVKRDSDDPRQINVKFFIEAIYPLNYIDISFGFSTSV